MQNELDRAMSIPVSQPRCPRCGDSLHLAHSGVFDFWECPDGHGTAATLSELYRQVQDDEIAQLWALGAHAGPGPLPALLTGPAMARITLGFDADELRWGAPGDAASVGHPAGTIELDVDVENQFIWFDRGELESLPRDLTNPEATQEELDRVANIAIQFGEEDSDARRRGQPGRLTELFADRLLAQHPGAYRSAEHAMRAITPM